MLKVNDIKEIMPAVELLANSTELKGMHVFAEPEFPLWDHFSAGFELIQAAGGVVLDEQDRLLAIRRLGKWDLPKGKVENGEDLEQAALREVEEECGIRELRLLKHHRDTWHTYRHKGRYCLKHTVWYLMRSSSAETLVPQHEEDIELVRWVARDEAAMIKADTYPSLLAILENWEKGSKAEA